VLGVRRRGEAAREIGVPDLAAAQLNLLGNAATRRPPAGAPEPQSLYSTITLIH
jgi:hypothetical protein